MNNVHQVMGVYFHIPWCDIKCAYCDFYSIPKKNVSTEDWQEYVDKVQKDFESKKIYFQKNRKVVSVYFGGGTPSKAPPFVIDALLSLLQKNLSTAAHLEITLEVNPESASESNIKDYAAAGVNRIHAGVQSRSRESLRYLGRLNTEDSVTSLFHKIRKAGIENYGMDIITGIPGQKFSSIREDLWWGIREGVSHISSYSLMYEEGTALKRLVDNHRKKKASARRAQFHFDLVKQFLEEEGYSQYEVSNFALPGKESVHNLIYWKYRPYLGIGASAHSFTGFEENYRMETLPDWSIHMETGDSGVDPWIGHFRLLGPQNFMRSLRLLDKGQRELYIRKLQNLQEAGFLLKTKSGLYQLTDRGIKFSDSMLVEMGK